MCLALIDCDVVSMHDCKGVIISVGVSVRDGVEFITCCVEDPRSGCQHISTRSSLALVLIERLASAMRVAFDQ